MVRAHIFLMQMLLHPASLYDHKHRTVVGRKLLHVATVQLNLNFTHRCRYIRLLACLMCAKLQKLACAYTVAHDFGLCMWDIKHTRHTRDARH